MSAFRPDAFLIVRPSDGLRWTSGMAQGFALVAVRRFGEEFLTADGGTIPVTDSARLLFPQDAERAVRRGIVTNREDVLIGTRFPALAVFPHLRARHVPDSANEPGPDQPPEVAAELDLVAGGADDGQAPEAAAEADAHTAPDTTRDPADDGADPAIAWKEPEAAETGGAKARDEDESVVAPSVADHIADAPAPLHNPDNITDVDSPDRLSPQGSGLDDGEALQRATAALERGGTPEEDDLEILAETPAAMSLILDRSEDLPLPLQAELADKAVYFLAATEDDVLMHRWLVTTAERLIGQSDLLVQLLRTWLDVDARTALGQLRAFIRIGAVSLSQRNPVEVAVLLRDAARVVGDADSLREAYESMAQAPKRARDSAALRDLLADLGDEDGPTAAELRAIGLPILLQAFKVAKDDDLLELASVAEQFVRHFLRTQPPNAQSARLLEPILVRAHDRATETQRPSIENILRELRDAEDAVLDVRPDSSSTVAVTYEELLRAFDGRSGNLEIVDAAYESARAWGRDGTDYLPALRDALEASVRVADRYAAQEFGPEGAIGAFEQEGHVLTPDESDTALRHRRTKKAHIVKNRRGQPVQLGPHLHFGQGYRLYLAFDRTRRVMYIGRIGDHLPGKKSKNRPRS